MRLRALRQGGPAQQAALLRGAERGRRRARSVPSRSTTYNGFPILTPGVCLDPNTRLRKGALAVVMCALLAAGCASKSGRGTPVQLDKNTLATTMDSNVMPEVSAKAPIARQVPFSVESPSGARNDVYYWLRDDERKNAQVIAYLEAENAYAEAELAHTAELRRTLYDEMIARLKPDDASVPVFEDGYFYGSRFEPGREYAIHYRRRGSLDAPEQILIDGNARAEGHTFYSLGDYAVSPDDRVLAFSEDTVSRRQYKIRFRDLSSGRELTDVIGNADPGVLWSADARSVLYVEKNPKTLLGYRVKRHVLGTPATADTLVFENGDESYYMGIRASKSREFLFIDLESTEQSETRFVRNDGKSFDFQPVLAREDDHEYQVEHVDDDFIVRSNWQAPNFRMLRAPIATSADKATWKPVIAHDPQVFIDDFDVFATHLVVNERSGGLKRIRILPWSGGGGALIGADDPTYTMSLDDNREIGAKALRYRYSSLTTPGSVFDVDLETGERTLRKTDFAGADFDASKYTSEFLWIDARDGARVPVSVLYPKGMRKDGTAPSLIYSYGSYGISSDPSFRGNWLSLVDRGFVVAIPHIRGGQEMGREWYEQGRLLNKKNTFNDFIDATRALVARKYIAKDRVFAEGGSAGGLLMGAIANMAPGDYRGILAHVPFVDVVTTMLDESIPLTTNEFDEWGNPQQKAFYDYLLSYSPYDNVRAQDYPAILVLTGLHDSQVQYWEPAKWVARLRRVGTGDAPILFRTRLEAGHGGASGRFKRFEDTALAYAFVLDQAGMAEPDAADYSNANAAGGSR